MSEIFHDDDGEDAVPQDDHAEFIERDDARLEREFQRELNGVPAED